MNVKVSIPSMDLYNLPATWDGHKLILNHGTPWEGDGGPPLVLELTGSQGPCGCGRGDIFFPPMCDKCWVEMGEANQAHALALNEPAHDADAGDEDPSHRASLSSPRKTPTTEPLALPSPQEMGKAVEGLDKWDPSLLEGWTWGNDKADKPGELDTDGPNASDGEGEQA